MKYVVLRIIRRIPILFFAWVLSTLTTTLTGVFFQTQNVISKLGDIGAEASFTDRLSMTAYDIQHLGSLYGIFIFAAFLIAFLTGGTLLKLVSFSKKLTHFLSGIVTESFLFMHFETERHTRAIVYTVAGAVAVLVMLFAMKANFFDVHIIAGARDAFGISLQMLAGAIGGFVFAQISRPNKKASAHNAEASIV